MKKQLLKFSLLALVVLFGASAAYAQADLLYTKPGWYKLGARGTNLFMTINGATGNLEWAEEITSGDTSTQEWRIQDHRTQAGAGFVEITSKAGGLDWTMTTSGVEADGKNLTITVEMRTPKEVEVLGGDLSGLDQFQRRKAKVDANGDPDSGGANPAAGNNALFIKTPWDGGSRYGIIPSAAGDPVQFDGSGIDVLDYHFVRDIENTASVNTFGIDAFSISNPLNNQLVIKGATADVNKVTLYSVLGNKVLSKSISNQNGDISLDVSSLSTGLYIVEMNGVNGERFTKKVVKQ
ncbi:T9SS type A sorting domain-containing protein [Polaribacter aestuariivivens]|uniref:T9SS type A sorting domain-containing protein n=1 Tax=Polaribacter aestuariivivens TaxID=2304626 RepID=UPI003F4946C3